MACPECRIRNPERSGLETRMNKLEAASYPASTRSPTHRPREVLWPVNAQGPLRIALRSRPLFPLRPSQAESDRSRVFERWPTKPRANFGLKARALQL